MSEIEKLLGQCGLPQYYKKLLAANITTRAKLLEKRAILPSLISNRAQLQHLIDTVDNKQPSTPRKGASSSSAHPLEFQSAADKDEADVDDSLPVPEECDDPVWAELSRWEHVLRRRLRYLSEARSDAMLARSNTFHFSSAAGAGKAGSGRAVSAAMAGSVANRSRRVQDTRRQQMQFDHIKTLLAMARNAMKQHRRNAELIATERRHTYRGAASSREEDATKEEADRGVEMVRRILIVLQEDGPTLMYVDVVHRGAEGNGGHDVKDQENDGEDEEFKVDGKEPAYVDTDTPDTEHTILSGTKPARSRRPAGQARKETLQREADEELVDIGADPRQPILVSQRHLDLLEANELLDRYAELHPGAVVLEPESSAISALVDGLEASLLTAPSTVSNEQLPEAILASHRNQSRLLAHLLALCTQQQASTRELLLRVKCLEEEAWAANDARQRESIQFAQDLEAARRSAPEPEAHAQHSPVVEPRQRGASAQ